MREPSFRSNRKHSKKLGQNFLVNAHIAEKIAGFAAVTGRAVIEIGPGNGILTRVLCKHASRVHAVELDKELAGGLQEQRLPGVEVINDDILNIDIGRFPDPVIVGNIPYSITTPILAWLVAQKRHFERAVITIQKEYAERLLARMGTAAYGSITLFVSYSFDVKKGFIIPAGFFSPKPKISSMVISLAKKNPPFALPDEKKFFGMVKGVFSYRRKTIKNALIHHLGCLPEGIAETLLKKRPQNLSLQDFKDIFDAL
jgi:16S rRNA (adenine1518-N6/adenine1519-N6)-dimethyltransferase